LEPVLNADNIIPDKTHPSNSAQPSQCNSHPGKTEPWSLDWRSQLSDKVTGRETSIHGSKCADRFIFTASEELSGEVQASKKQSVNNFKHSASFLKLVARMSSRGRKEILKILMKKGRKRKDRMLSNKSKEVSNSTSEYSKNSNASVYNDDWTNLVVLNEKSSAAQKDVTKLGKVLGAKFSGDPNNSFNLLTREGRK
jgi:hypothetical protein